MREFLADLMDSAAGRADYADVRHVHSSAETVSIRNGRVELARRDDEEGVGVRVRIGGSWGFAAARGSERSAAEAALERAIAVAEAQPATRDTAALAPVEPARGTYATELVTDPFDVPLEDKLAILGAADEAMRGAPRVVLRTGQYVGYRQRKTFCSTEGAICKQRLRGCGGGIPATAA